MDAHHSTRVHASSEEKRALAGKMTQISLVQLVCSHFNPFAKNNFDWKEAYMINKVLDFIAA